MLITAGISKRSFGWFNKMGLSNSYCTALKRNGDFGVNYDEKAMQWKHEIEKDYAEIENISKNQKISFHEAEKIRRLTKPVPTTFKVAYLVEQ